MAFGSPVVYADFSGGINKQAGPYLLNENQCQDARNVTATPQGGLQKRRGFAHFSDIEDVSDVAKLDGRAHSLAAVNIPTYGKFLIAVGKTPSASTDSIVSITTGGVAAELKSGLTQDTRWEFVQMPSFPRNEIQSITVTATGGTFTLTFSGETTSAVAYDATADTLYTALIGLSNIDVGDVAVTKAGSVFSVTFQGVYEGDNVAQMTVDTTSLTGGSATVATVQAGTVEGPLFGINGVDTPQQWTGTGTMDDWTAINEAGAALDPHPAKNCKFMVYHLDRIWASGDPADPGRVFGTGVDNNGFPEPRNWDALNHDYVDPADGEQITGLGKVGPYLLVFKNRKTYVLTDPVGRAYRAISSTIGCVSHRSIVETVNGTIFLSEDLGVCITDGTDINVISDAIEPLIRDICKSQPSAIKNAAATYLEDSYYLSVPYEGSNNSITLEYHLPTGAWWIHTCASNQFALLDPSGTPKMYSAFPTAQRIEEAFAQDTYADNGTSYESYWEGPYWAWGDPHMNKRINQLRADGLGYWQLRLKESFNRDYSATLDEVLWEAPSGTTSNWGEGPQDFGDSDTSIIFGAEQGISQKRYATPVRGWGRAWSLKVSDEQGNSRMELYSVAAFTRPRTD